MTNHHFIFLFYYNATGGHKRNKMAALPPPPNFVLIAVRACGVPDVPLFNNEGPAQRITAKVFEDDFATCKNLSKDELNDSLKSYSNLTVANGRIVLNPLAKKRLYALIEWANGLYRVGQNPVNQPFPVAQANTIIEKSKGLNKYKDKVKTITEAAKPAIFTQVGLVRLEQNLQEFSEAYTRPK